MAKKLTKKKLIPVMVLAAVTAAVAGRMYASAGDKPDLDQCANLALTCDTSNPLQWQNGDLNGSNSHYSEGESVPYRATVGGLTAGQTYALTIEWDTTKQGKHALDYLTSVGRTESTADPCAGVTCSSPTDTLPIAIDSDVTAGGVTQVGGQMFSLFGGSFVTPGATVANSGNLCGSASCPIPDNPAPYTRTGTYADTSSASTTVWFTPNAPMVVLAWSGHVASETDWGAGTSASAIAGSPYHMRLIDFACSDASNCSVGNEDRSMSASAVIAPSTTTTVPPTTTTTEPPTTTTTEPPTTTTTEPPTTTTTTEPPTTTTLPPTTTTLPPTTTTLPPTTTSTVPASTSTVPASTTSAAPSSTTTTPASTTTVKPSTTTTLAATTTAAPATTAAPTTTVAATTTTSPSDFAVIFPATTTTSPGEQALTFPSTLPTTGMSLRWMWIALAALIALAGTLVPLRRRDKDQVQKFDDKVNR